MEERHYQYKHQAFLHFHKAVSEIPPGWQLAPVPYCEYRLWFRVRL